MKNKQSLQAQKLAPRAIQVFYGLIYAPIWRLSSQAATRRPNKKTLSDNLDNDYYFALMIISAKVESRADPVIFCCLPFRVRLTFLAGAISNNLTNCFGGLF